MAAYAALVSLMNNIEQIRSHPRLSSSLGNKQIQLLLEKAALLLDFIEGNNYGGGSKEAEDLEREIACVAHAAEDVIESHIVDQIHAGSNQESLTCWLDLLQIVEDMDVMIKKAYNEQFNEKDELGGEFHHQPSQSTPTPAMESGMVGFKGELNQLIDELTQERSSRHIISIVGMGGIGKTTLARKVYERLLIMQHFDIYAWATISQHHNLLEILSQLLSGQGKSSFGTVDGLGEQLHKTLWGRRYLIILDDVWSVEVWDEVSRFFPDNGNGSRVVLTTRLSNLAVDCGSSCLTKNLLNENESWELFCKKAFQREDGPPELEKIGKEIVKLCKGLPLSIVVISGRLLKSPRTLGYWEDVANEIKSFPNSKVKQESLDVLFSSYNHLPPHLKPCFLYTGVLKRSSSEIPVSKMIRLWIAVGFIKSNGSRVLEEIAEDYLKDLIDRNLILVGRRYDSGKIKCCDIHDILRDLCITVGEQQEFVSVSKEGVRGTERRLICDKLMSVTEPSHARSIMAFEAGEQVLHKHRLLRILEVVLPSSPEEIFGCVNLRYLAYLAYHHPYFYSENHCKLVLPTSVFLPWNLQILMIKVSRLSSGGGVVAPTEIWKMRQLRHVECHRIYLPESCVSEGQDEFLRLENLQTLKTAVNLRLCEDVCKMIPNIKKLNVAYEGELYGYDDCLVDCLCNLNRLDKLESLKLIIEGWRIHKDRRLSKIVTFPSSLNKLSLSLCGLHWDDLTMIGSLPQLQVLKLNSFSVTKGEQWSPIDGQFLRLRVLKIYFCDLVCWNAESCHFPVLEKLVLRHLGDMEEIPSGIGEIPTLKLIRVEWCSESVAISAMKIKQDQLETQGNDDLQILVKN